MKNICHCIDLAAKHWERTKPVRRDFPSKAGNDAVGTWNEVSDHTGMTNRLREVARRDTGLE